MLDARNLNAARMQIFSQVSLPHFSHCSRSSTNFSSLLKVATIKRSYIVSFDNASFLWILVLRLVFHDAKIPAVAKNAAQFSNTGDESYSYEKAIFFPNHLSSKTLKKGEGALFLCHLQIPVSIFSHSPILTSLY